MGKEYRFGRMEANMKAIGAMGRPKAKADSYTLMETSMKANGQKTKPMGMGCMYMQMEGSILGGGKTTNSMDMALKSDLEAPSTQVIMSLEVNMDTGSLNGLMGHDMKALLLITISTEMGVTAGLMAGST